MYKRFILLSILIIIGLKSANSQGVTSAHINEMFKEAKEYMDLRQYDKANATFRKMLSTNEVLPIAMSYYFAETLYMIRQFHNSKSFLDKYLSVTEKGGDYYEQAVDLQNLLEKEFSEIENCNLCDDNGYTLTTCNTCNGHGKLEGACTYCKGKGIVVCSACSGEGVQITQDKLGEKKYQSCDKCDTKGYLPCPVCNGSKNMIITCSICQGTGEKPTNQICSHQKKDIP